MYYKTQAISNFVAKENRFNTRASSYKTANYLKPFVQQLQPMGAQMRLQLTHVVFDNGHPATWRKAKKSDVRLVSDLGRQVRRTLLCTFLTSTII
uniref:Uncharacterized protein n=1 Tax=Sander lucioperca TaxID=283035 RepID=A0A8C9YDV7_SANLU